MPANEQHSALGRIGRYQLLEPIASGRRGAVYLARLSELGFEKLLAIKILLPEITRKGGFAEMFRDEARIAARLGHPNIAEIFELGEDDGRYFIAMPYLRGVPMTEILRTPATDRVAHARLVASIVAQAAEGLDHAHGVTDDSGSALVHGEISPPNLFVTVEGVVKVLDFGVARTRGDDSNSRRDELKSKNAYSSPEQLRAMAVDHRTDIFSLGIVLYEGITGTRLFARNDEAAVAKAVLEPIVDPRSRRPEVSPELAAVTLKALARKRDDRYATARALAEALGEALSPAGRLAAVEIRGQITARFPQTLDRDAARVDRATTTTFNPEKRSARRPKRKAGSLRWRIPLLVVLLVAAVLALSVLAVKLIGKKSGRQADKAGEAADASVTKSVNQPGDASMRSLDAGGLDARSRAKESDRRSGRIIIKSTLRAAIYVDGRRVGRTPLNVRVRPGRRRIRAVVPNREAKRFTITVEAGKPAKVKSLRW